MDRLAGTRSARLTVALAAVLSLPGCMPPSWAANALLHPPRRPITQLPTRPYETVDLDVGVHLHGWLFRTDRPRRGLLVYLHGVGDNRTSGIGVAAHFNAQGFDVLAYDSRAHGESGGDVCTYGYYEKKDLGRAIDQVGGGPVLAFGISLGAAVALQAAADDPRIALVVAVSSFSDLRTVGAERAPFFASRANISRAFELAEAEAAFSADDVSPVGAAGRIRAPVLLVHGADDRETRSAHSERIYAALAGPKRLVLVPGAGHNGALNADAWRAIDGWVDAQWPGR